MKLVLCIKTLNNALVINDYYFHACTFSSRCLVIEFFLTNIKKWLESFTLSSFWLLRADSKHVINFSLWNFIKPQWFITFGGARSIPRIARNAGNHESGGKFHKSHQILNQIKRNINKLWLRKSHVKK